MASSDAVRTPLERLGLGERLPRAPPGSVVGGSPDTVFAWIEAMTIMPQRPVPGYARASAQAGRLRPKQRSRSLGYRNTRKKFVLALLIAAV